MVKRMKVGAGKENAGDFILDKRLTTFDANGSDASAALRQKIINQKTLAATETPATPSTESTAGVPSLAPAVPQPQKQLSIAVVAEEKTKKPTASDIVNKASFAAEVELSENERLMHVGSVSEKLSKGVDHQTIELGLVGNLVRRKIEAESKQEESKPLNFSKAPRVEVSAEKSRYSAFSVAVAESFAKNDFADNPSVRAALESKTESGFNSRSQNGETNLASETAFSSLMGAGNGEGYYKDEAKKYGFSISQADADATKGRILGDQISQPMKTKYFVPQIIDQLGVGLSVVATGQRGKTVAMVMNDADDNAKMATESETSPESEVKFPFNEFDPKRMTSTIGVIKQSMLANSQGQDLIVLVEGMLREQAMKLMSEQVLNGNGTGVNIKGLNTMTATSADLALPGLMTLAAWKKLKLTFEKQGLDYNNIFLRVLLSSTISGSLKGISHLPEGGIALWSGNDSQNNTELGLIDGGYRAYTPHHMPLNGANEIMMMLQTGDLALFYWQNADILVNPYRRSRENIVEVTMDAYWNFGEWYDGACGITKMSNITG